MSSSFFWQLLGMEGTNVFLCKGKQLFWICMEICVRVDDVSETECLKTPKGCLGVAFSGVLLIWKTEKHAVIEMCYVTGLLAIEKNKSCFLEIAQKFSLVVFPFKGDF